MSLASEMSESITLAFSCSSFASVEDWLSRVYTTCETFPFCHRVLGLSQRKDNIVVYRLYPIVDELCASVEWSVQSGGQAYGLTLRTVRGVRRHLHYVAQRLVSRQDLSHSVRWEECVIPEKLFAVTIEQEIDTYFIRVPCTDRTLEACFRSIREGDKAARAIAVKYLVACASTLRSARHFLRHNDTLHVLNELMIGGVADADLHRLCIHLVCNACKFLAELMYEDPKLLKYAHLSTPLRILQHKLQGNMESLGAHVYDTRKHLYCCFLHSTQRMLWEKVTGGDDAATCDVLEEIGIVREVQKCLSS